MPPKKTSSDAGSSSNDAKKPAAAPKKPRAPRKKAQPKAAESPPKAEDKSSEPKMTKDKMFSTPFIPTGPLLKKIDKPINFKQCSNEEFRARIEKCDKLRDSSRHMYRYALSKVFDLNINIAKQMLKPVAEFIEIYKKAYPHVESLLIVTIAACVTVAYKDRITRAKQEDLYDEWRGAANRMRSDYNQKRYSDNRASADFMSLDEVLKKLRATKITPTNHLQVLIIAMYTLIPPARQNYVAARILKDPIANPTENNVIILGGNSPRIVINDFKTARHQDPIVHDIPPELLKIIEYSLEAMPRDYLFGHRPVQRLCAQVNKATKNILGKAITVNGFRHIYASAHDFSRMTNEQHAEFARKMGHSVLTSWSKYRVVHDGPLR